MNDWQFLGGQIQTVADSSAWWLGDWLLYGQNEYPNRYRDAIAQTALDYQTLRNYAWVARRFAPDRRRARLSFQHHAEVAGLPENDREPWLTQAEEHGWSRNELRRRVRGRGRDESEGSTLHLRMNLPEHQRRRWQDAAASCEQDLLSWMTAILDSAAVAALRAD